MFTTGTLHVSPYNVDDAPKEAFPTGAVEKYYATLLLIQPSCCACTYSSGPLPNSQTSQPASQPAGRHEGYVPTHSSLGDICTIQALIHYFSYL